MVVTYEIRDHHERCVPYLARLRVLASYEVGEPLPSALAEEVGQVVSMILAEADAAARASVAAVTCTRQRAVAGFLASRMARLASAAREAIDAANQADTAMLSRNLHRFEALTTAMWTVQLAMPAEAEEVRPADRTRIGLRRGEIRGGPRPAVTAARHLAQTSG